MGELSELIKYLENKYNEPVSFMSYLINTYGEINNLDNALSDYEDNESVLHNAEEKVEFELMQDSLEIEDEKKNKCDVEKSYLVFKCDKNENLKVIERLLLSIKNCKRIFDIEKNEAANKLVKKYIMELKKMEDASGLDEGEKLAEKYTKILKKTLMKLWGNKRFLTVIRQHLDENAIHVEEYEIGHRLADEEFELLDEQLTGVMAVKTYNSLDKYKIIDMIQPIIKVYYENEDAQIDYAYIPGCCKFYN